MLLTAGNPTAQGTPAAQQAAGQAGQGAQGAQGQVLVVAGAPGGGAQGALVTQGEPQGANPGAGAPPPGTAPIYLSTFFNGTLPAPQGHVVKLLEGRGPPQDQRTKTEAMYQFLVNGQNDLWDLNGDNTCFTVLVAVPDFCKFKLVYGMGFGTAGIGQVSTVAGQILTLYGKGEGALGPPQELVLDLGIRQEPE